MTYDEFMRKSGIECTEQEYKEVIEPMYEADNCDKYVFISKNFEKLLGDKPVYAESPFDLLKNNEDFYKLKYIGGWTATKATPSLKKAMRFTKDYIKTLFNNYIINGKDLRKFQRALTLELRNIKEISYYQPFVSILSGGIDDGGVSFDTLSVMFYDQNAGMKIIDRKEYDDRSFCSNFGLEPILLPNQINLHNIYKASYGKK